MRFVLGVVVLCLLAVGMLIHFVGSVADRRELFSRVSFLGWVVLDILCVVRGR